MYDLQIKWKKDGKDGWFTPIIADGIQWETEREGMPSKLSFTVVKDDIIRFEEGAIVTLRHYDEETKKYTGIFKGFVFEKTRDKNHNIKVIAYDQLRYFKNKLSINYTKKKASELLTMLAKDVGVTLGTVEDTGYTIPFRDEDNSTLFDIILNALYETSRNNGKEYVLYDDFGKICLVNTKSKLYELMLCPSTAEDFSYTSSIDKDTLTEVLVIKTNSQGKVEGDPYLYPKGKNDTRDTWGVLREVVKAGVNDNPAHVAETIFKAKNRKTRDLEIKGCLGDLKVRAGVQVYVDLNLGDIQVKRFLMCDRVVHRFNHGVHLMDVTIKDDFTEK